MNKVTDAIKILCLPCCSIFCDCAVSCAELSLRTNYLYICGYKNMLNVPLFPSVWH